MGLFTPDFFRALLVGFLIGRGFDLHAVDRWYEKTPLAWAVEQGRDDVADILRRAGAER